LVVGADRISKQDALSALDAIANAESVKKFFSGNGTARISAGG
jgi:hypothetical protein